MTDKITHPIGRCSTQGEEPSISYLDKIWDLEHQSSLFPLASQRKTRLFNIIIGPAEENCTFYRSSASTDPHLSLQGDCSHHLIGVLPTPWLTDGVSGCQCFVWFVFLYFYFNFPTKELLFPFPYLCLRAPSCENYNNLEGGLYIFHFKTGSCLPQQIPVFQSKTTTKVRKQACFYHKEFPFATIFS